MSALHEMVFHQPPELLSGIKIGRKLGAGKQANVYEYGDEEVAKILQPHWRVTNLIGGDWQAQLAPRLSMQKHYLGNFLPVSRVENDVLTTGERISFVVQEMLDSNKMKKLKDISWREIAESRFENTPITPSLLSQLDAFTQGVLSMIDRTGCTPDLSGNNDSLSSHFDPKQSQNMWIHEDRGLLLVDVVNPGPYYVDDNPLGHIYVSQMRDAVVNFRNRLGFDVNPIVAG